MRRSWPLLVISALLLATISRAESPAGNAEEGREVFEKCAACHSLTPNQTLIGPSLAGVIGRKAGSEVGFEYSDAMRQSNVVWTPDNVATYLADPQKFVPGNHMPFPGLPSAQDRADVIAYLQKVAAGDNATATAAPAHESHAVPKMVPEQRYTLRSGVANGRMVFIGIDGVIDPEITAVAGETVQITLINGEGMQHNIDVVLPQGEVRSPRQWDRRQHHGHVRCPRSGYLPLFLFGPWAS